MSLVNDSIVLPGTGSTAATQVVAGKEHQGMVVVDESGHIVGSLPTYFWTTPQAAPAANKLHLDLFNDTGSGKIIKIQGIWAMGGLDTSPNATVGTKIDLYRTSTVGTGGTAWVYRSATANVDGGNVVPADTANAAVPAQITGRHASAATVIAGATIDDWVFPHFTMPDDVNTSQGYTTQRQNMIPELPWGQKWTIREGQGLLLKQGAAPGVGAIRFLVAFTLE